MNSDTKRNFSFLLAINTSLQQFAQTAFQCWGDHSIKYFAPGNWKGWWHTWDGDFSWPWYHYTLLPVAARNLHLGLTRWRFLYVKNANQSKQYRIYIKESKSWVDVNKEFYTDYYRDISAYRKRQQEHGRCVCPASKCYLCDMDCLTCPYAKAGDQLSLDNTISDGDGNKKSWLDDMPDESVWC